MTVSQKEAPLSLANMKPMIKRVLDLRADIKDMTAELKELEKDVKPALEGRGKLQVDNYIVEVKQMKGRKTLDKEALTTFLEKHGAKIEDFEKVGAPFAQLNMSEAAEKI